MSKKNWILNCVAVCVLGLLAGMSFFYTEQKNGENFRGRFVFNHTRENIRFLQKIKMTTPEFGEINVYRKNGGWYFKEASDYFVNTEQLANFYYMVNNSIFTAVQEAQKKDFEQNMLMLPEEKEINNEGTTIETFDSEGKLMDRVIIGKTPDDGESYFARLPEYPYVYTINSVRGFSGQADAWVPFPLLKIQPSIIENLDIRGTILSSDTLNLYFSTSLKLQNLLTALSYLGYTGIVYKDDIQNEILKSPPHLLKVETTIGLVYILKIFEQGDSYWLAVNLEYTKIPRKEVIPFVNENKKYFDKWYFQLDTEQGKILYESKAKDILEGFKL